MRLVELGDIADFVNGAAFKPEDWGDEGNRIIRIQNLTDITKPFNRTTRKVSEKLYVYKGDLLVSWSATLGVFEWVFDDIAVLNQHIFRVLPNKDKVDKNYLRYILENAILDMKKHLHGATMLHVNRGEFLSTKVYLPELSEQKRIAAILDKADEVRVKRRQALEKLEGLAQSVFVEMFGEPGKNPKKWPMMTIAQADLKIADGNYSSKYPTASEFVPAGVPFVRANNMINFTVNDDDMRFISEKKHSEITKGHLKENDVLITTRGEIGKIAIVPSKYEGANINAQIVLLRPTSNQVNYWYLATLLNTSYMKSVFETHQTGVALKQLPIGKLNQISIIIPPESLQMQFAVRMDKLKDTLQASALSADRMESMFMSLQQKAFKGEL